MYRYKKSVLAVLCILVILIPIITFAEGEQNTTETAISTTSGTIPIFGINKESEFTTDDSIQIDGGKVAGGGGGGGATVPSQPVPIPPKPVNYKVFINGNEVISDGGYYEKDGIVLGALRTVAEALGVQVNWNGETREIIFTSAETTLILSVDSNTYTLNGSQGALSVPPQVVNGRTLIPIQFVVEAFGGTVEILGSGQGDSPSTPPTPDQPPVNNNASLQIISVPTLTNGFNGEATQLKIKSAYDTTFNEGDQFYLSLPTGVSWNDSYSIDGTITNATYHRVDDRKLQFTVVGKPSEIIVPLHVEIYEAEIGVLNLIIEAPSYSSIPSGEATIVKIVDGTNNGGGGGGSAVISGGIELVSKTANSITISFGVGNDLRKYEIYRNNELVHTEEVNTISYFTDTGLKSDTTYKYRVVFKYSGITVSTQELIVKTDIDECFIATASYGSKFEPTVVLLRQFRDQYLMTNVIGEKFVEFYYKNSPPIADFIRESEFLKFIVRGILTPIVAVVYLLFHPVLLYTVMAGILGLIVLRYKKKLI